ncbi:uncharacterized protein [Penaeus vannamei]|uniref:uncharacterized protein n=1 Tax=Penaeus vannamei TaxID=6689 RepID=UPI00387F77F0
MHRLPEARQVPVVRFQTGNLTTTNSYLDTGPNGLPELVQVGFLLNTHLNGFSLCAHLRFFKLPPTNVLFSYYIENLDDELLFVLRPELKDLVIACGSSQVHAIVPYTFQLYRWQHICVSVDLQEQILISAFKFAGMDLEIKSRPLKTDNSDNPRILPGGRVVLGQEQDTPEGGFYLDQVFHAEVADFSFYDGLLTEEESKSFLSCAKNIDRDPLLYVDEEMTIFTMVGDTEVSAITEEDLCFESREFAIAFPFRRNFYDSMSWCNTLKGYIVLPSSAEENKYLHDKFERFNDLCVDQAHTLFYIGLTGSSAGEWKRTANDEPVKWTNFHSSFSQPDAFRPCATVESANGTFTWFSSVCDFEKCIACDFDAQPRLLLRGFCPSSLFERNFYLHDYVNGRPLFDGKEHSRLYWNSSAWVIVSRRHPGIRASMVMENPEEYPIGLHTWEVEGDACGKEKVQLQLTSCNRDEFTCNNGSCIAKARRCDLVTDCADLSDELNCEIIHVPGGYSSALPPPKPAGNPVAFLFFLRVLAIREINLSSFRLTLDAVLSLRWRDSRLLFMNLQKEHHANKAKDTDRLWTPRISIRDGIRSAVDAHLQHSVIYVVAEGEPAGGDDAHLVREETVFSGQNNSLVLEQELTLTSTCQFELRMYPLDSQSCSLTFIIEDLNNKLGVLVKDGLGLGFEGSRRLLEYQLVREEVTVKLDSENVSVVQVDLLFENLYGYYIGNTLVPSLLLITISYLTLFFKIDDFQDRIMVSLTSILVMATFFTQTSANIPKTSYLKLIDAWYVTLISTNFLVLLAAVVVENLRLDRVRLFTHVVRVKASCLNQSLKLLFPAVMFLIILIFLTICLLV